MSNENNKSNKTFADELLTLVQAEANNNPAPEHCTIVNQYNDGYVDVLLTDINDIIKHVPTIGDNTIGSQGVICYLNGDINNQIVIVDNTKQNELNTILALGLGLFTIREDGHLWVELPMGISNPFTIDDNGHLIVTIPEDASNDYEIIDNHLIYHRGE